MNRIRPIAVLLVLAVSQAVPAEDAPSLKEWIRGPIRYVSKAAEAKAFRKLDSDNDRALFIEHFWARRDPTSGTLTNEYRQKFWERVQQANAQFLDSPGPGWKTDRGKIFILYGAPTEIQDEPDLATGGLGRTRGLLRWIYDGRPEGRTDLNAITVVPFTRDSGGQYRVDYDPKLSSVFFDAQAIKEGRDVGLDRFYEIFGGASRTPLSVMLDLGKMQEVPPQAQVILERVETAESYRTTPLEVQVARYHAPGADRITAVVTIDVSDYTPDTTPAIVAKFTHHDPTHPPRVLGEDSFRVMQIDDERIAQGRIELDPGAYDLAVLAVDPRTAQTGMDRRTMHALAPSEMLRLSDVTWAAHLESLQYATLATYAEPFHVGAFLVHPRLRTRFRRGEPLTLFFEIYGGQIPYRVSYLLEGQEEDGSWVALGKPSIVETSASGQGWELPTSPRWPLGPYRVSVEVEDRGGAATRVQVPFELADSIAPAEDLR